MKINPEHKSIEAFVQYCIDDEVEEFTHADLNALAYSIKLSHSKVRKTLEDLGLRLTTRPIQKSVRGFTTSSNDRWFGPGSCPTHGGAGIDPTTGRVGK